MGRHSPVLARDHEPRSTSTTGCGFLGPREVSCKPLDALCFCCYRPSQSKLPILLGVEVAKSEQWQCIPTRLSIEQFQQFVLPHLSIGSRGPAPKLTLHAVFNYILQSLYLGCQWKELPIEKDQEGRPEIHYTRIYGAFRRWQADGCFDAVFAGSVAMLHKPIFSTPLSSMAMVRRHRRRKAATTSVSAGTRRSRATRSSPSAIAIAMSSRRLFRRLAIAMNRRYCEKPCRW